MSVENKSLSPEPEIKSDEVKDIIDKMPGGFGVIVSGFVLVLAIALLFFGYFIKYPDIVKGELVLNTAAGPVKVVSNSSGKMFIINIKSKDSIRAGKYIGYIQNSANFNHVCLIDSLLHQLEVHKIQGRISKEFFPADINLGELNEKYFDFLNSFYNVLNHYAQNVYGHQEAILRKQASSQKSIIRLAQSDLKLARQTYDLTLKSYNRDSILYSRKVLSVADLENTKGFLFNAQRNYEAIESKILNAEYELEDVLSQLEQLNIQKIGEKLQSDIKATGSYYELVESIKQWQLKYAFISPMDGVIEFTNFWNNGDYIASGQELFSIIPATKDVYAQVFLPEVGAGKVRTGQKVIIKLNDFPFAEYGTVKGTVTDISLMTNQKAVSADRRQDLYLLKVNLDQGLKTNFGTELAFKFGAKGAAEIITADRRLYERIFDNFRYQIKK